MHTGEKSYEWVLCGRRFMSMPECCEHMLYHWVMMPYQCQHCSDEFYTVFDLKHHHRIEHPDAKLYLDPKGPTLSRAVQCIENPKMRPQKNQLDNSCAKKPRMDDSPKDNKEKKAEITSGIVINTYKVKKLPKSTSSPNVAPSDVISVDDDEDDLVIVTKTDDNVPSDDDVFACEVCVHVADSEALVLKHLREEHQVKSNKYHVLSKRKSELETTQKLACNICAAVFTELKLRRHFIGNHFKGQFYAPFRFKCGLCPAKFLNQRGMLKAHFSRAHPSEKLKYNCVIPPPKTDSTEKQTKYKQYSCTLCTYTAFSVSALRSHLKGHLKPILCNHCNIRFKYHNELLTHTGRAHAGLEPSYTTLDAVVKALSENMKLINQNAIVGPGDSEANASEVNERVSANSLRGTARKSTSAPFVSPKAYSTETNEHFALSQIKTTFELDKLEYTTTAEQMMKIINMDTYVDVSDCVDNGVPMNNS